MSDTTIPSYTKILKTHDASVKAWIARRKNLGLTASGGIPRSRTTSLGSAAHAVAHHAASVTAVDKAKFSAGLNRIAKLTDNNAHGKAVEAGAKLLGMDKEVVTMQKLNKQQAKDGHLTGVVHAARMEVYNAMMEKAKKVLDKHQYSAFHGSF